jgi:hypothetical protein
VGYGVLYVTEPHAYEVLKNGNIVLTPDEQVKMEFTISQLQSENALLTDVYNQEINRNKILTRALAKCGKGV